MKTKEFIKKVQALGYEVEVELESMFIIKIEGTAVCDVSKTEFGILDTDSCAIHHNNRGQKSVRGEK